MYVEFLVGRLLPDRRALRTKEKPLDRYIGPAGADARPERCFDRTRPEEKCLPAGHRALPWQVFPDRQQRCQAAFVPALRRYHRAAMVKLTGRL